MNKKILLQDEERDLVNKAAEAMKNAHIVWKNSFAVGAAVLAEGSKPYQGCNIESRFSGLGVCAERCAIDNAVSQGKKPITKIAIVMPAEEIEKPRPCGACLQYIYDFSEGKAEIIMARIRKGEEVPEITDRKTVLEMLPLHL